MSSRPYGKLVSFQIKTTTSLVSGTSYNCLPLDHFLPIKYFARKKWSSALWTKFSIMSSQKAKGEIAVLQRSLIKTSYNLLVNENGKMVHDLTIKFVFLFFSREH